MYKRLQLAVCTAMNRWFSLLSNILLKDLLFLSRYWHYHGSYDNRAYTGLC